ARERSAGRQRTSPSGAGGRGGAAVAALARGRPDAGGDRRADLSGAPPGAGRARTRLPAHARAGRRGRPGLRTTDETDRTLLLRRGSRTARTRARLGDGLRRESRTPPRRPLPVAAPVRRARLRSPTRAR